MKENHLKDYYKAQIKLNNFYFLYNSIDKKNNKVIKEIFSYKEIKNKNFIFDEYSSALYEELINIIYDCFECQLKIIYKFLNNNEENDVEIIINNLPIEVKNVIDKSLFDDMKLEDFISIKDKKDKPILYYLSNCCDYLIGIIEMIYETEKYEKARIKYLSREEGKEERILLNFIKKFSNKKYCNF